MSYLRRLFVSHTEILEFLKFPVLKEIAIDVGPDENVLTHLEPSLIRSSCSLGMLSFAGCPPADATIQILQKFPSIRELAIIVDTVEDGARLTRFMASLTVSETEETTVVAPHLNRVSLGCEDKGYIDHDTFLKMVKSRWRAEHCALKSAAMFIDAGEAPMRSGFSELYEEGLDFFLAEGLDASEAIDFTSPKISFLGIVLVIDFSPRIFGKFRMRDFDFVYITFRCCLLHHPRDFIVSAFL
ncbi:hypothetical protein C8F04DRAFT_1257853 [Mycena alexandri]|uniref:Uncharacterized protein n=1 Tax=Mycena alexandri TaxID=1745969 RepID=A0AAD6T3G0_9AGAR|nr:hypothetical protein C8F04DRAFT_1257853 [Mycena alexandri]